MNRDRIFDAFRRARDPMADQDAWMSLADAAMSLRASQRDSDMDRMSRGLSDDEDSLLAFWAHRVAQVGVPVYGRRIMSTAHEVIPAQAVLAGRIRDGATRLGVDGEPIQDFGALRVQRAEFEAFLARADKNGPPA